MMMMLMLIISRIMVITMMFVWIRLVVDLHFDNNDDDHTSWRKVILVLHQCCTNVAPMLHLERTTLVQKVTGMDRGL